jgi:hypothetical protein
VLHHLHDIEITAGVVSLEAAVTRKSLRMLAPPCALIDRTAPE